MDTVNGGSSVGMGLVPGGDIVAIGLSLLYISCYAALCHDSIKGIYVKVPTAHLLEIIKIFIKFLIRFLLQDLRLTLSCPLLFHTLKNKGDRKKMLLKRFLRYDYSFHPILCTKFHSFVLPPSVLFILF